MVNDLYPLFTEQAQKDFSDPNKLFGMLQLFPPHDRLVERKVIDSISIKKKKYDIVESSYMSQSTILFIRTLVVQTPEENKWKINDVYVIRLEREELGLIN